MVPCGFTLDHYCSILDRAMALGYRFRRLRDYHREQGRGRTVILRHDVDLSLSHAVTMAEEEGQRDIRATFFVRVHAKGFNPFSRESYEALGRLLELGCEIALQHEVGVFPGPDEEAPGLLGRELAVLESVIGRKVAGATIHMPKHARFIVEPDMLARCGIEYDASGPEFNEGTKFLSDSNRVWDEGCLCTMVGRYEKLYVNIHPFWWFPSEHTPEQVRAYLLEGN